jgi:hypothetical protein
MKVCAPDPTPYLGTLANLLADVRPFETHTNGSRQPGSCQLGLPGTPCWTSGEEVEQHTAKKAKSMSNGLSCDKAIIFS